MLFNVFSLFAQDDRELRKMETLSDTLFKTMSIEELIKIQKIFKGRVDNLRKEEEEIRGKGLEVSESFVKEGSVKIKDQDKILIRVAEYYIEEGDDNYEKEFDAFLASEEKYLELLNLFDEGQLETEPDPPKEPVYDYSKAIEVYDKIVDEFPQSEYSDDALYSKAFLLEKMKQGSHGRRIYQEVIDKYPESLFAAESYMRLAEYYFAPRENKDTEKNIVELQKAIKLYKNVLNYRNSKRYDEALYKLGWSYYKLAAVDPAYYSDAIIYFLAVVDDIKRAEDLDPNNKISTPSVKQEAIAYIGISFSDEDTYAKAGVGHARKFIENIGGRDYGVEIMRALGETYQKVENFDNAVLAYTNLLDMYPKYVEAPLVTQKIAESYYDMGRDQDEYNTRQLLFANYNPNSEWYDYVKSSEIPDRLKYQQEAYQLTERALYTNIVLDQENAQRLETDSLTVPGSAWQKVIDGCQEYLNVFSTDSNAYTINWNYAFILDAKLSRYEESFEQYMHVSNDYLEKEFQEKSAVNAIFVAETLVTLAAAPQDTTGLIDFENPETLRPDLLTENEKRVIEAYNNYIKLFPNNEMTPVFLAKAGGIYFNHRQFAEAKVYFNTLVRRFPGAKQKSIAYRSIMNSYFALGKFKDSELIAKQILQQKDIPDEDKIFAEKRLAQSIFKNAKLFQDQGQYLEAALEYRRVFDESSAEMGLVDAALYNSAYMYDEIQEWKKAVDTYLLLVDKFPESEYSLRSLNNAAEDYKEMKQYADAGNIFTQIYEANKADKDVAEPALSNASYYYVKGEEWQKAITANDQYISIYPDEDLAVDLFFANAGNYLKLNNLIEANRIYENFATRYPTDPKAIEAFYHRGVYFKENTQLSAAKVEFTKSIDKSEQFSRQGLDPNRYYVGESLNELVGMLRDEFSAIELKQPDSNITSKQNRLKTLIREIVDSNKKIIANGSIRSFEAVYNSASIYDDFATVYSYQERKSSLDPNQLFAENKLINEQSAQLYDAAVDQYKIAMKNIPLVAEKLGIDIFAAPDTTIPVITAEEDSALIVKRAVEKDSTREVAYRWYKKAEEKISALLYKEAELTRENVSQALATTNPQNDPVAKLIYQLRLVNQIVAPAIKQTIAAHKKNIEEANTLNLHNKYVEESKRQILLTSNILAEEIEELAFAAIVDYPKREKDIVELVEQEYGATNAKGEDYSMIHATNQQLIDLSKELANATINNYVATLDFAKEAGIENDLVRTTSDRLFRFSVQFTDMYEEYKTSAINYRESFIQKFDSTENYNFEDASLYFQDYEISFEDYEREILDNAYFVSENYGVKNLWVNKLLYKLVKIDPATYAGSIEKDKLEFSTDDSWVFSTDYVEGYVNTNFDDSSWRNAGIIPGTYNQFASFGADPASIWRVKESVKSSVDTSFGSAIDTSAGMVDTMMTASSDTSGEDSSRSDGFFTSYSVEQQSYGDTSDVALESDTVEVYFRKNIEFDGSAVGGAIYITADDDYRLFINGEYIIDDADDDFTKLDSLDYETISYYLKPGVNVFVLDVIDYNKTAQGAKLYGYFEVLPADLTAAAEENAKIQKIDIDPIILKKVNILNKNRISINE
jgi:tetratricopeptide (TPR) repeat protein